MLVDINGRPLRSEKTLETAADVFHATDSGWGGGMLDPGLRGGWIESGGFFNQASPVSAILGLSLNRDLERRAARVAYLTNPVLWGALEVIASFVIGEGISYGEMADPSATKALEDFWFENDLEDMASRFFLEYMIDGESLTVFPEQQELGEISKFAFYDVDDYIHLHTVRGLPHKIDKVEVNLMHNDTSQKTILQQGSFAWTAYDALWNDPRGWPVIMRAIGPALAYTGFVNTRMRIHDIQSRINAIYWAFASDDKELQAKSETYKDLPRTGRVLTMHKLPTGEKEEFEFVQTNTNAMDSAADGRLIRLVLSVALNLPEHYLGEGGDVNRTTADAMGAPAKKAFKRKQKWVKRWLDMIFRNALIRRYGPDKKYKVNKYKVNETTKAIDISSSRVPATRLEFPWTFPEINDEDAMGLVRRVQLAASFRLASQQTLSGQLGYDYAAELERFPRDLPINLGNNNNNEDPEGESGSKLNAGVNKGLGLNPMPDPSAGDE